MNRRRFWMFIGLAAVVVGIAGFFVWERYEGYSEYRAYKNMERRYIEAMTSDTYGGKTPQETLDLFVAALRAEDVDLASKYFMLDDNLSREKWVKTLGVFKERGFLDDMVRDIGEAIPNSSDSIDENDFKYILLDKEGLATTTINFRLNTYSKVWKIESL